MGWNTVVFLLNDQMHEMSKAPHGFTHLLTNPPMAMRDNGREAAMLFQHARDVAREHNEPAGGLCQITVMPTFHADNRNFYMAGHNDISQLEVVKYSTIKGRKCVLLALPDYMQDQTPI